MFQIVIEHHHERLQVTDDLVNVFDYTLDGLVLVHHAIDAEAPDSGTAERRQQHATHRIAERVAEAPLERLQTEFCNERIVLALRRFDELRANKTAEIDCCHEMC